jgi:thioredoxin-dependent peroxiredoxin
MSLVLKEGDWAPDFQLPDSTGKKVRLSEFRGKKIVVLYFYPKDDTPGCTREACSFRDSYSVYKDAGAEVLGVSVDGVASHERFASKYNLTFTLLSDQERTISKTYGVLRPAGNSTERVTFIIDKDGRIAKVFPHVRVEGHSEEVLAVIKNLQKAAA